MSTRASMSFLTWGFFSTFYELTIFSSMLGQMQARIRDKSVIVESTTLDISLFEKSPSLIKIDVEGYETLVVEGAKQTLQNPALKSVIMELNGSGSHYGFNESDLLASMLDYGFKTYSYDPFKRTLLTLAGKNLNSGNTLFVRDITFVEERLNTAGQFRINDQYFYYLV